MDAPYFAALPPSGRLRLLIDEIRHEGPEPWLLIALEYLADELEASDPGSDLVPGEEGRRRRR